MIANLLCVVGLILQPLLVVPSCACMESDAATSSRCCAVSGSCGTTCTSHRDKKSSPIQSVSDCGCCAATSSRCCPDDDRDTATCRKFSNPVCVIPLAADACPCGCCSGPMAPVSAETAPRTVVPGPDASTDYSPPPEAVVRLAQSKYEVQRRTTVAGSYDSIQSRLCVWLN